MKRRHFLIGATALAAAAVWWKRPGDRGQPYDAYFSALNRELAGYKKGDVVMLLVRNGGGSAFVAVRAGG